MSLQTVPAKQKEFYPQLEALRGIAILLVVLYHYFPSVCPKGYLGVDVFLMLSGFLLFKGFYAAGENFSFFPYITKKLIRLLPPFICMALCCVLLATKLIPSVSLLPSLRTCISAIFCASNLYLSSTGSVYFADNTQTNLFTHTWYLSVTVQAFIVLGLLFFLIRKMSHRRQLIILLGLSALSVAFCFSRPLYRQLFPGTGDFLMYYSTCGRMWEFLLGGAIVSLMPYRSVFSLRYCTFPLSGLLIAAAFIPFDTRIIVIPLAGVLIFCATQNTPSSFPFTLFPLQYLGKISFSVYLWHWPLLVIWRYYYEGAHYIWGISAMVAACSVGIVSYYLIEKKKWHISLWLALACCLLAYTFAYLRNPAMQRFIEPATAFRPSSGSGCHPVTVADYPDRIIRVWKEGHPTLAKSKHHLLLMGDKTAAPSFVLIGDSHARAFSGGLNQLGKDEHLSGYYLPAYITPFENRMAARVAFRFSKEEAQAMFDWLEKHPELHTVVIVQRWSIRLKDKLDDESLPLHYDFTDVDTEELFEQTAEALEAFCRSLQRLHKNLILVTEAPLITEQSPLLYVMRCSITGRPINKDLLTCTQEQHRRRSARHNSLLDSLQSKGLCRVVHMEEAAFAQGDWYAIQGGTSLMTDDDHLSAEGAALIVTRQKEQWLQFLRTNAADE